MRGSTPIDVEPRQGAWSDVERGAGPLALGAMHAALFALMRGDRSRSRTSVSELTRIVSEHDLPLFRAFGVFLEGWATAEAGAPAAGLEGMRRGVETLREQNVLLFDGLLKITVSESEARAGDLDRAVATLDEALATTERAGFRAFEPELHRTRGDILLRRDPANPAPAEEALLIAIAVAGEEDRRLGAACRHHHSILTPWTAGVDVERSFRLIGARSFRGPFTCHPLRLGDLRRSHFPS